MVGGNDAKDLLNQWEIFWVVLQKISLERNEPGDPSFLLSLGCHSKQAGDEDDLISDG